MVILLSWESNIRASLLLKKAVLPKKAQKTPTKQKPKQIMEMNSTDIKRITRSVTATSNRIWDLSVNNSFIHFPVLFESSVQRNSSVSSLFPPEHSKQETCLNSMKNTSCLHRNSRLLCFPSPKGNVPQLPAISFRNHDRWWTTQKSCATLEGNPFHCIRISGLNFACTYNFWLMLIFRI